MLCLDDGGTTGVREDVSFERLRRQLVERGDVGDAAAEDDHRGIEDVHNGGEGASETFGVTLDGGACGGVAILGEGRDLLGGELLAARSEVIGGEGGAGEEGFDAVEAAAVAATVGPVFIEQAGHRVVAPLTSDGLGSGEQLLTEDESAADAGSEDDAEDACRIGGGAIDGLGEGEAVGVVLDAGFELPE